MSNSDEQRSHFRVRLLGPVCIEHAGEPVTTRRSRRAIALLAYLVSRQTPDPRDTLVELLWPEKPAKTGRANLRWVLHHLKTELVPDALETTRRTVTFRLPAGSSVDVLTVAEAIEQGDIATLGDVLREPRGEFMAGFYLDDAPAFESWLVTERERWRRRLDEALGRLIDHHEQNGDYEGALTFARRRLERDPWHEASHREVMRLLAHTGQVEAALEQYDACRQMLAEKLDTEPTAETEALYERLQRLGAAPRHNLPSQPTPFVGRASERATVEQHLARNETRLVTIAGPGGIGKTRLALKVARDALPMFLDGVAFIPLAPLEDAGALADATVATLVQEEFIPPLGGHRTPADHLSAELGDREMLLILDNVEHLITETTQALLLELIAETEVTILVTSRVRLNLRWEHLVELDGLAHNDSRDEQDAIELFVQSAKRSRPTFTMEEQNRADIIRICRLVEGMPLALELAAGWVRVQSCASIADQIAADADALVGHSADLPARHRSMDAVFTHSWHLLSEAEQTVLRRLSVFRTPFTANAARQVAGASRNHLATLIDRFLLRQTVTHDEAAGTVTRYDMHPLLQQFARAQFTPHECEQAQGAHADFFLTKLSKHRQALQGSEQARALADIEATFEDIRAAWRWAAGHEEVELLIQAREELVRYLVIRARFAEGIALMDETLNRVGKQSHRIRGVLLAAMSWFYCHLGDYDAAVATGDEGVTLCRDHGSRRDLAVALVFRGVAGYQTGDYSTARQHLTESLEILKTRGDDALPWQARCYMLLGLVACGEGTSWYNEDGEHVERGDHTPAKLKEGRAYLQRALTITRQIGNRIAEVPVLHNLGYVAYVLDQDYEAAVQYLSEALTIADEFNADRFRPQTSNWLGKTFAAMRRYEEAEQACRQALQGAYANQNWPAILDTLSTIGDKIWARTGRIDDAIALLTMLIEHPKIDARLRGWSENRVERHAELLSEAEFAAAKKRGRTLDAERVVLKLLTNADASDELVI